MIRKIMKPAFLFMSFVIFGSYLKAADVEGLEKDFASHLTVADGVLIEREFVDYFKKAAASESGAQMVLHITVRDLDNDEEKIDDEKTFDTGIFPDEVSKGFIFARFDSLGRLLPLLAKRDLDNFELKATLGLNNSTHRERVNGFSTLRNRK